MPIKVEASEGLLTAATEKQLFQELFDSFLRINGALGNPFITPNMIGDGYTIPAGRTYSGNGVDLHIAIGLKVPGFALPTVEQRKTFVEEATEAAFRAAGGKLAKERIFVNLLYGDGMWGIGGVAYTDETLAKAIEAAAK